MTHSYCKQAAKRFSADTSFKLKTMVL
uniref:Uncharacterized protein n=1 Tax=Rhizophora mucronata TaxID=61149 RepID=A0A2P2N9V1_RHIMU